MHSRYTLERGVKIESRLESLANKPPSASKLLCSITSSSKSNLYDVASVYQWVDFDLFVSDWYRLDASNINEESWSVLGTRCSWKRN
jgi:hypothetical protein